MWKELVVRRGVDIRKRCYGLTANDSEDGDMDEKEVGDVEEK